MRKKKAGTRTIPPPTPSNPANIPANAPTINNKIIVGKNIKIYSKKPS